MNKKEVSEIKKLFKPEKCSISRICGCYVDGEKEKKAQFSRTFLSFPEEVMYKYFDIFKKSLSGTLGKNLLNMEFPTEQEFEGGKQEFLMKLRSSKLNDDSLVQEFYDHIINTYDYSENYYIILIHAVYDIPGRTSDGLEMDDASDEIYDHIMGCICPVNLTDAGLSYNTVTDAIESRTRDWLVQMPDYGFLFPLFNDRSSDIHGMLYYSRNPEMLRTEFVEEIFGCTPPLSAKNQKNSFNALVEETLEETCELETVVAIHEKLNEIIDAQKDEPDPVILTKSEVKRILEDSGVDNEKMEAFEDQYDLKAGETASMMAKNITSTRHFEVKTPDVVIHVDPLRSDLLETKIVDGKKCIVIPLEGDIEVNGIHVH
ncbi:MAG: DUF4317 domain-containing protein [Eubacteriales bacterium]|nr:DUF4317 domain-containing protein [Eubacteriales bacterium]